MVHDVVCPRDQWLANASAGKDFLTSLTAAQNQKSCTTGDNHGPRTRSCEVNASSIAQGSKAQRRRVKVVDTRSEVRPARSHPRSSPDASERCWLFFLSSKAMIATTTGTQPSRRHSSKAIAHTLRSGGHTRADRRTRLAQQKAGAIAGVHQDWRMKVKVSSRCIGVMPNTIMWKSTRRVGVLPR